MKRKLPRHDLASAIAQEPENCGDVRKRPRAYIIVTPRGRVAQLGEHLLCKQGVAGSIPATSTNLVRSLRIHAASSYVLFLLHYCGAISGQSVQHSLGRIPARVESVAYSFCFIEARSELLSS